MADDTIRLVIDGNPYELHPDDLELGEVELLEETMDMPLDAIDFSRAKAMRVLVFILVSRKDRTFTMDDAAHMKLSSFAESNGNGNGNGGAKRPTKASGKGASVTATSGDGS